MTRRSLGILRSSIIAVTVAACVPDFWRAVLVVGAVLVVCWLTEDIAAADVTDRPDPRPRAVRRYPDQTP